MAHNLEIRNDQASMAYYGERPWHGLGTPVEKAMTAEEALKLARLDFRVAKVPLVNPLAGGEIDGFYANIRLDTKQVLGVVKDNYKVIQNADMFKVFDELVSRDEAIYHTAGVMGVGQRTWILAKLPDNIVLKNKKGKEDVIEKYILVTNSHDGNSTAKALMTPVRVVCNNTLSYALSTARASEKVSIRHTASADDRLKEAMTVLGISKKYYEEVERRLNQFTLIKFTDTQLNNFVDELLNIKATPKQAQEAEEKISAQKATAKSTLISLYHNGTGSELFEGTAYNYYQAVTEYVSHLSPILSDRVSSMMFGKGASMRQRAFDQIMDMK